MISLRTEEYVALQELAWFESRSLSDAWPQPATAAVTLVDLRLAVVNGSVLTITPYGRRVASAPVHDRTESTVVIRESDT